MSRDRRNSKVKGGSRPVMDEWKENLVKAYVKKTNASRHNLLQQMRSGGVTTRDIALQIAEGGVSGMEVDATATATATSPAVSSTDGAGFDLSVADQIAEAIAFELELLDEAQETCMPPDFLYDPEELGVDLEYSQSTSQGESPSAAGPTLLCPVCFSKSLSFNQRWSAGGMGNGSMGGGVMSCPCGVHVSSNIISSADDVRACLADIFDRHAGYCGTVPKPAWEPLVGSLVFSSQEGRLMYSCRSCRSIGVAVGPS